MSHEIEPLASNETAVASRVRDVLTCIKQLSADERRAVLQTVLAESFSTELHGTFTVMDCRGRLRGVILDASSIPTRTSSEEAVLHEETVRELSFLNGHPEEWLNLKWLTPEEVGEKWFGEHAQQ